MRNLDHEEFNSYFGRYREHCTGGRNFFDIHPDGSVYRCAHMEDHPIGNIEDDSFRDSILIDACRPWECASPICVKTCGGSLTEQWFDSIHHVGSEVWYRKFQGKRYAILNLSLTPHCNYSCDYCSADPWMKSSKDQQKKVMNKDEWLNVARWYIQNFDTGMAAVLGGEPTIHPVFLEMGREFCEAGWWFDIITNLSIRDKIVEFFGALSSDQARKVKLVFSAHVHQKKFDLFQSCETLRLIRSLSPYCNISVTYVDDPSNLISLSPEKLKAAIQETIGPNFYFNHSENVLKKIDSMRIK